MKIIIIFLLIAFSIVSGAKENILEKDISGIDIDRNGIRDDIDEYIKKQSYSADQLKAVKQLCRSLQLAVTLNSENRDRAKAISKEIGKALECLYTRFKSAPHPAAVSTEFEKLTSNTKIRRDSYKKYNQSLDGTVSALSEDDTCEK